MIHSKLIIPNFLFIDTSFPTVPLLYINNLKKQNETLLVLETPLLVLQGTKKSSLKVCLAPFKVLSLHVLGTPFGSIMNQIEFCKGLYKHLRFFQIWGVLQL